MKTLFRFIILSAFVSALVFWGCGGKANDAEVQAYTKTLEHHFVPDKRVDVWDISVRQTSNGLELSGEVLNPLLPARIIDSLQNRFDPMEIVNHIVVLPDSGFGGRSYGIVKISVANIRKEPWYSSELVNQAILGHTVRIFKEDNGFYFVQNSWDNYLGWISKGSLNVQDSLGAATWVGSDQVVCTANYGTVQAKTGETLVDLVPGARLRRLGKVSHLIRVETPADDVGFVDGKLVVSKSEFDRRQPSVEDILKTAQTFLGIPYLWGGTSAKGFDCSGFVQTAFRLHNLKLPRDASQMALVGDEIASGTDFANLQRGDLLFFGSARNRISHIAIYLGNGLYIHSSFHVHVSSLDKTHPLYNDYRFRRFQLARRVL